MTRRRIAARTIEVGLLFMPAGAQQSCAMFDRSAHLNITRVMAEFDWANPLLLF